MKGRKIVSRDMLIDYIKLKLGYPQITIEITDEQISLCIDDAIQIFTEFAYDGLLKDTILVELKGKEEIPLPPEIRSIVKISKGGTSGVSTDFSAQFGENLVPTIWSEQFFSNNLTGNIVTAICSVSAVRSTLKKYFGDDINFNFNPAKSVLQVFDSYRGPALIEYYHEYIPNDDFDKIFDHQWVKAMAIAKCKQLWGGVLGKFSGASLVGGAQINYSDLKTEGQNEEAKLLEELKDKYFTVAPIDVC